jgi:hypothetical protein
MASVDLRVRVDESLVELSFGLNASILHVFEVLAHVLHLVAKVGQVGVLSLLCFNHFDLNRRLKLQ